MNVERVLRLLEPFWRPHPGQRAFLESEARIKVLACGRRWGKTDACAVEVVAALHAPSPTRHVILAPTQDQANLLLDRVAELLSKLPMESMGGLPELRRTPHPRLRLGPHRVTARSGHLARALRGNEATHLVIDEAAFVPESLILEVAMPMLATSDGRATLISTPNGRNHFWRFYRYGLLGEHGVWSRTGPSAENPMVSEAFLSVQRELLSDRAYATEYLAEFRDSAGQVFRTEAVESCVVAHLPKVAGTACIGVDFGKSQDATAVAVLRGTRQQAILEELHGFQEPSWARTAERIAVIVHRHPGALVIADGTGAGDAVIETLEAALGRRVRPFLFDNRRKGALIDDLVAAFEHRRLAIPALPDLLRELQHYEAGESLAGNRLLGAASGYHDDLVTALALGYSGLRPGTGLAVVAGSARQLNL